MTQLPPKSTLFPYTTLFRSIQIKLFSQNPADAEEWAPKIADAIKKIDGVTDVFDGVENTISGPALSFQVDPADRKSTRLNSSHRCISYAVFCLKKKIHKSLKFAQTLHLIIISFLRDDIVSSGVRQHSWLAHHAVHLHQRPQLSVENAFVEQPGK